MKTKITFEELKFLKENQCNVKVESHDDIYDDVTDVYEKYGEGLLIKYYDGTVNKCHNTHRILISTNNGHKWVVASELQVGDICVSRYLSDSKKIECIDSIPDQRWIDFTIDNDTESYVQNDIIHHNSGKSLVIYFIVSYLLLTGKKTALIVPNVSLVEQIYSDFKEYGWDNLDIHVNKLYSGQSKYYDASKPVLITTWQSIVKKQQSFFNDFDAIVVDETHGAKSVSIQGIAKKCINADYRLGLTGTLPTDTADIMNISGYIGPNIFSMKSSELIDRGVLSQISIANVLMKYPEDIVKVYKRCSYVDEVNLVKSYEPRNKVFDEIFKYINDGQNSLILCHLIEHLRAIEEYIVENFDSKYKVCVIYGKVSATEREQIRHMMEKEENVILIGTYSTMSTGINIKKLHNVIFASSYKSKIKILQSIGRGLRTHDSKEEMILWDLIDDLSFTTRNDTLCKNHVYKHWEERKKFYTEQGFKFYDKTILLG